MSKLVIAEKPSVANSIADVLGANQREDPSIIELLCYRAKRIIELYQESKKIISG